MRYLIGLILCILVIIFIIIKLLGGGGSDNTQQVPKSLMSYADTGTTVRYTMDNPIQAPQNHRSIIITVGNVDANLTITKGFDGEIISSKNFDNTVNSYSNFLAGLQRSGNFTHGNSDPKFADQSGYCATGNRYSYDIISPEGTVVQHFWSTSCGVKTFEGNINIVQRLFQAQIPDFNSLTSGADF